MRLCCHFDFCSNYLPKPSYLTMTFHNSQQTKAYSLLSNLTDQASRHSRSPYQTPNLRSLMERWGIMLKHTMILSKACNDLLNMLVDYEAAVVYSLKRWKMAMYKDRQRQTINRLIALWKKELKTNPHLKEVERWPEHSHSCRSPKKLTLGMFEQATLGVNFRMRWRGKSVRKAPFSMITKIRLNRVH